MCGVSAEPGMPREHEEEERDDGEKDVVEIFRVRHGIRSFQCVAAGERSGGSVREGNDT